MRHFRIDVGPTPAEVLRDNLAEIRRLAGDARDLVARLAMGADEPPRLRAVLRELGVLLASAEAARRRLEDRT